MKHSETCCCKTVIKDKMAWCPKQSELKVVYSFCTTAIYQQLHFFCSNECEVWFKPFIAAFNVMENMWY